MKLTPLDIRHKEFKRGMRGYAEAEVDEFLDLIADDYEQLLKESVNLRDRAGSVEEKSIGYKRTEELLQKALVSAQITAEETKQRAQEEAQRLTQEAEQKARQLVEDAEQRSRKVLEEAEARRQGVERAIEGLRATEQDFRVRLRGMLDDYLRMLDNAPVSAGFSSAPAAAAPVAPPADDDVTEFVRQAQAIKAAIAREQEPSQDAEGAAALAPADDDPVDFPTVVERRSILTGEGEGLLADVDPEVNANEFKW